MIYAITYSNELYENPKKWNLRSALENGVDAVRSYAPEDIDDEFYSKNKKILNCERGNGYWLWKPYFIRKTLQEINYGDYLVYADAGSVYVNNINILLGKMEANNDEIMVFDQPYFEREWTKRDAFILMDCDKEEYCNSHQIMATFLALKKSDKTVRFIEEWLAYCEDERIITDNANVMGKENYQGFVENRYDQSVLSLMAKKSGLRVYDNPSCLIHGWVGEAIDIDEVTWLSHKTPYVRDFDELLKVNRSFFDQYWDIDKKIVVYGTGHYGKSFLSYARKMYKNIDAFVVTSNKYISEKVIDGIPVYSMDNFPLDIAECKFVVATKTEIDAIICLLEKVGAEYVVFQGYDRKLIYTYWKRLQDM